MPTTKEELETFIKEYLTNNLSIGIAMDDKRINVSVILGEEEIAYASTRIGTAPTRQRRKSKPSTKPTGIALDVDAK